MAALSASASVQVAVYAIADDGGAPCAVVTTTTGETTTTETVSTETAATETAATETVAEALPAAGAQTTPDGATVTTPDAAQDACAAPPAGQTETGPAPAPPAVDVVVATPEPAAPKAPAADAPVGVSQAAQDSSGAESLPAKHRVRHHPARRGEVRRLAAHRRPKAPAQVYFPPVSVDWNALTPLAPPPFPGAAADDFPGPYFLLPIFQAAATQYNVPWQVLASINEVESAWGTNTGPSSAGAIGWMQFLPSTWQHYGLDANGDGVSNPEDPVDAIFSAARYLHDAGAEDDLGRAIFAYNHANWYVDDVVRRAIELGSIPEDLLTALTEKGRLPASRAIIRATGSRGLVDRNAKINSIGRAMMLGNGTLERVALRNKHISIYECGREDIEAGVVDRRVLEVLAYLTAHHLRPTVTSLRCGHGFYTTSGNVSEHSSGDAVDISAINGVPILGHQGPGSITEKTIKQLLKLAGGMKPHQIISLMTFQGATNTFAMGDHANHIHVGFRPLRDVDGL